MRTVDLWELFYGLSSSIRTIVISCLMGTVVVGRSYPMRGSCLMSTVVHINSSPMGKISYRGICCPVGKNVLRGQLFYEGSRPMEKVIIWGQLIYMSSYHIGELFMRTVVLVNVILMLSIADIHIEKINYNINCRYAAALYNTPL